MSLQSALDQLNAAERDVLEAARDAEADGSPSLQSAIHESKIAVWNAMDSVANAIRENTK